MTGVQTCALPICPVFLKDDDGAEILFEEERKYLINEKNGIKVLKSRNEKVRKLNDDLPLIVQEFLNFKRSNS